MIQIYSPTNTDYTHNGDQTLFPSAATVHVILNGSWTAELTHPIDADGRWKSIVKDAVVKMPSFNGDQLFRIKSTSKSDSGVIAAMEPIFMDSMGDCFLVDIRPTSKNGQQALNDMVSPNSKYSASSDITRTATAYYEYKNLIEAIAGDDDNAFLKRWGGEILYDNFTVIINERVGGDYGVEVRYGKNIPQDGVTEEVDTSAIITRIYPKAYNGYTMTNHGHVDSPLINSYPTIKAATLTFDDVKMAADAQEDDAENGVIICNNQAELDQALTQKCQEQYDTGMDKPTVSLDISMVLLQNTEQYKDYQILETASLGDTIHCRDSHLDITSDARVIELGYDSIQKRVSSVVIGDVQYNYFDQVTDSTNRIEQVIRPNGTLMAERVQGILNGIYTQLRLQSTAAQKVNGSAFLVEDTDPESALYGAMVWGTQGLQLSVVRTADGRSWDWTTAVTAKGIVADAIVTGILSDKEGKNYWNLDTGEFRLSAESFLVDDETVQNYVDGAIDDKIAQIRELTVQLSNEVTLVPTSADGTGGNYSEAYTDVSVYLGTSDVSAAAQITVAVSAGVTGSWNPLQRRYSVTYLESDVGAVTFTVTYSGLQMSKTFTVAKTKQGQPGAQGIPGPAGDNGQSFYTWIKYADTPTSGMSDSPDGKEYMGIAYNKTTPAESTNYSDYQWSLIKGSDGSQGVPGPPGEDGQTLYTWIKYATSATGANMSDDPDGKTYLGIAYNKTTATESNNPADYTWAFFEGPQGEKGDQGIPGPAGADGQTLYTWIKYADTPTSGMSDNPDGKEYMGIAYNKTSQTESNNYGDYQWSLIKGANGSQGIPGPAGADGQTLYTWIKYADTPTSGMSDNPDGKEYMGIAYNKTSQTESNNYGDYQWSLIKGAKGDQGIPGPAGEDGQTFYTWIKYADTPTSGMSDNPDGKEYMGIAYNKTTQTESSNYSDYQWSLIKGANGSQGIPGPAGEDGKTLYTWIKYADTPTSGMSDNPDGKEYMGIAYNKATPTESSNYGDYQWSLIKGAKGDQGIPGPQGSPGTNGKTSYFHVKYSANSNGNPMTETPSTYIGTYVDFTEADSSNYRDYTWSRFQGAQGAKGEQGIPGTNGINGQTSYLHIKYSNDGGASFTSNNGETPGKYIGQYVDFNQTDSTDPDRYTWSLTQGADGRVYQLQADTLVIKQGADNAYNPPRVTFSAYYRNGTSANRVAYAGRFVISESTNGTTYITKYTSSANEASHTYTPSAANVKNIRCILYASGGTTNALDMQGVAIVRDIDNLTQEDVFNILTNNGVVQGIYLQNGQLYINAEYIATGRLASVDGSSYWDLNTGELNIDGKLVFDNNQLTVNGNVNVPSGGHVNVANGGAVNIDNIVNGRYHRVTVGSGGVVVHDYGTNTPDDDTSPAQVASMGVNTSQPVGLVRSVRYSQSSAGIPQAIQDFTNIIGGTIQSSNGSKQSTMTPTGVTTTNLTASEVDVTNGVSAQHADFEGRVNADSFNGVWITMSGWNRFRVDWADHGTGYRLWFYIDNTLVWNT